MLSGDNGLLNRTTEARERTIHANVLEQMQLEASAYTVDKSTGKYSDSLINYLKSKSIISDISGEEDKWLINVTTLLGSNQSMGNGTYPNDVYVLEKQSTSTGSIVNTKVATTIPIKIATTTTSQVKYNVKYYGNNTSESLTLGNLFDDNSQVVADDSEKLKAYFNSPDSRDGNGNYIDNDTIGVKISDLIYIGDIQPDTSYHFYNGYVYKEMWDYDNGIVTDITKINTDLNLNKFGKYTVDGINVLVDSNKNIYTKKEVDYTAFLDMGSYMVIGLGSEYFYSDSEGNPDEERPFIGYATKDYNGNIVYYDETGKIVDDIAEPKG